MQHGPHSRLWIGEAYNRFTRDEIFAHERANEVTRDGNRFAQERDLYSQKVSNQVLEFDLL